jgi:hypothetical protein
LAKPRPFAAVLRISDVATTKTALEEALQTKLDRFEPARSGPMHYAQFDLPGGDSDWSTIVDWIQTIGHRLSALRQKRLIGPTNINLAVPFHDDMASLSIDIPSDAAEAIGRHGIDIEFSVYLTSKEE